MHKPRQQSSDRRGLTLIETMIAMTITMLMVLAIAQAFQSISATITQNRAAVEMAGQLRSAANQLQRDLAGLTVPALPWAETSGPGGYLEIFEGPDKDFLATDTDTSLGDIDDALLFTARNSLEPFTGLLAGAPVSSSDAEIVWFMASYDANFDGLIASNERFLYRKVFLVRPELANTPQFSEPGFPGTDTSSRWPNQYPNNATGWSAFRADLQRFYFENDISVRIRANVVSGNLVASLTPNSLADLSARQNRFAHYPVLIDGPANPTRPPARLVNPSDFQAPTALATYPTFPYALDVNPNSVTSLGRLVKTSIGRDLGSLIRVGEDVILPNALAFDVRVFDPTAQVRAHPGADGEWGAALVDDDGANGVDDIGERAWPGTDDEVVTPGDPGFATVSSAAVIGGGHVNGTPLGGGAFVDLGYYVTFNYAAATNTQTATSTFSGSPLLRSGLSGQSNNSFAQPALFTYDTWSLYYEHDGVNQDAHPNSTPPPPSLPRPLFPATLIDATPNLVDEGTNGLDDDLQNGVDDPGERETSPPYPVPLRGIQVRLRMIEYDTRLVQQTSVVVNFQPQ